MNPYGVTGPRVDPREIYAWNADLERARNEYEAHPSVAAEEDWCQECCWPRKRRRCETCRAHMLMREHRARLRLVQGGAA